MISAASKSQSFPNMSDTVILTIDAVSGFILLLAAVLVVFTAMVVALVVEKSCALPFLLLYVSVLSSKAS